jgi:hypothetical protein
MPLDIVLDRSTLTLERILKEPNAEVARVMVSLYDEGRFLRNVGAEVVHQDDFGTLYRYRLHGRDLLMVKVVNSTPEPDGSFKDYFLSVHPELRPLPPAGTSATAWFANQNTRWAEWTWPPTRFISAGFAHAGATDDS